MIYIVEMNGWGCRLYGGVGNLLTFVSFCDKNTGVRVICSVGYSPENTVIAMIFATVLVKHSNFNVAEAERREMHGSVRHSAKF